MEGQLNLTDCSCPTVQVVVWAKYILEEVSIPVVGTVGLLGNLAAIIVLSHPDMKSTFHQSLITLAVFEILFLLLLICDQGADIWSDFYTKMVPHFLFPLKNIMMSCETYLLISIALERLIAVVRPLWFRNAKLKLSSWYHALVFILPTIIISVFINLPRFFELKLIYTKVMDTNNITRDVVNIGPTPLRLEPDYIEFYIFWTRCLGTGVIPILFLLVINTSIYLSLKRQRPTTSTTTTNNNNVLSERTVSDSLVTMAVESDRRPSVFTIVSVWLGSSNENTEISTMLREEVI